MAKPASRVEKIPPYLFARIDKKKEEARKKGLDLVDLSIGDPDLPTPAHIVQKMQEAIAEPRNHRYPSYEGMFEFRKAVADWYMKRFGVQLNPATEVVTLIGSKEGIAHIPWAYLDEGDVALIPSPGYPVYKISTLLAAFFVPTNPRLILKHYAFGTMLRQQVELLRHPLWRMTPHAPTAGDTPNVATDTITASPRATAAHPVNGPRNRSANGATN